MSANNYDELKRHLRHRVECVSYGEADNPQNVAIECITCGEVLLDYDQPDAYCLDCKAPLYLDECGDIFLCELCKEKYDLEKLWKDHDNRKIDALDFNENYKIRRRYKNKII